jgi:hypothetical protein
MTYEEADEIFWNGIDKMMQYFAEQGIDADEMHEYLNLRDGFKHLDDAFYSFVELDSEEDE